MTKTKLLDTWNEAPQNLKGLCKLAKSLNMTPMETYKMLVKQLGPLKN
jgi:hypothetical protein